MPASLKRMFGSPFGKGPKKNKNLIRSSPLRKLRKDNENSIGTSTPVSDQQSKEEESLSGAFFETDVRDQEYNDDVNDDDDFRSSDMASTSVDASCNEDIDIDGDSDHDPGCGIDNDNDNAEDNCIDSESIVEEDDFKTTVMASRSTESRDSGSSSTTTSTSSNGADDDEHSEPRLEYLPTTADDKIGSKSEEAKLIPNNEIDNNIHNQVSGGVGNGDDNEDDESPINSVVFEKQINTESQDTRNPLKIGSASQLSPLRSPDLDGDERDGFIFDDYRSTISGLTEATTNYNYHRGGGLKPRTGIPPSPTHSTNSIAVTKKMEDFLKIENAAIRQLLSHVDSDDDESTVVEECIRGANEAERMAREMEREMELLVHGTNEKSSTENTSTTPKANDQHQNQQDTPESNQFLTDILSVMHPSPDDSADHHCDNENKSIVSDFSFSQTTPNPNSRSHSILHQSPRTSRRDLFRKPGRLNKLKKKIGSKKSNRKKVRRCLKYVLRTFFLALVLSSAAFVVNWQWNFSDQDFSNATKYTMVQIKRHTPRIMGLVTSTTRATQSYIGTSLESTMTRLVTIIPTNRIIEGLRETSSFVVHEATHYTPILAKQTKTHVMNGLKATQAFAIGQLDYSYAWNNYFETKFFSQGLAEATNQYVKDRLEYAFTDRAAREHQRDEEERLQKLREEAAAVAAKEAAERQQQLVTQTLFAGACAFIGSVATNYLWSAF
jgi:hypothetical protein